jgi:hypothetical protein
MTKISVYNIDEYVTADDKWIGTDVNTYNKTKNFTPRKLSHYFNNNQVINTGVDLLYKYFTITPPEIRPTGTLSFETEIGQTVNFSAISTFLLSKTTLKGNDVVEFLNFLVGTKVLLYKAKNINLFGSYKIVSVEEYIPEPNFLVVNVEFIEGNGFIEEDEDYMISLIDINSNETQNLQDVVNIGNSISNYGGIGNASIQSTNFLNNRTLYLNNDSFPTIKLEDNLDGNHYTVIDIDTLNLSGVSYPWSSIVGGTQNLQEVTDEGNTIVLPSNKNRGIDITIADLQNQYSNGVRVTVDSQTGTYSNNDAFVAKINGQNPGSLPNFVGGFYAVATGADNYSFISEHNTGAVSSTHYFSSNATGITSDFAAFFTNSVNVFNIDYLGNTTAAKFIKEGGTGTNVLLDDGDTIALTSIESATTSPITADLEVGGIADQQIIPIGTNLQDFATLLLNKTYYPTLTAPTFALSNNAGTREIGSSSVFTLTFTYNDGDITGKTVGGIWQPSTSQGGRSGAAISYTINGTTQAGNTLSVSPILLVGGNTLNSTVTYGIGIQPLDSKGINYDAPYPAGTSPTRSTTVQGIYPYFWYKSASPITSAGMQTAIANGTATKVIASSTGTITIDFDAAGEYLAFAYPSTSTTKTVWYVTALSNGTIPGGVFGGATTLPCNSSTSLWSNVSYKIHVTAGLITELNPIELRNS